MHILPDLKKLEQTYSVSDGLVVIGVHSAKFENEKDSAKILAATQRYDISHPVVNDAASSLWMDLNIKCWPTLLVLGPRANPLFVFMGEGHAETLEKYIGQSLEFYREKGALSEQSLPIGPTTDLILNSGVKFPGKIACSKPEDEANLRELYALSDSGHHRIIVFSPDGTVIE